MSEKNKTGLFPPGTLEFYPLPARKKTEDFVKIILCGEKEFSIY